MRLLLDTHAVLWFFADDARLAEAASALIENPENSCAVSLVTPWEVAVKVSLGKLRTPYGPGAELHRLLERNGMELLPLEPGDFDAVAALPFHHRDPFDRLIIAQAQVENLPLLSADPAFDAYGVRRLW